jgi:hypothetical protein
VRKADLLRALQSEIQRHGLDTFPVKVDRGTVDRGTVVTPGCPTCQKTLYTVSNFVDHINNDVLPSLLDRLSKEENTAPPDADFIDLDYWASPDRKICRMSGEQDAILTATNACSDAEWLMLLAGLGMSDPES